MLRRVVLVCCTAALLVALAAVPAAAAPGQGRFVFNAHWGGVGTVARRHTQSLCDEQRMEPGTRERVRVDVDHGGNVVAPPGNHGPVDLNRFYQGWLYCGPLLDIWSHTSGPWDAAAPGGPSWLSITCYHFSPLDGGAGFWVSPDAGVAQVAGGFGSGRNGYWHYRFHNPTHHTVTIQFWAVCADKTEIFG